MADYHLTSFLSEVRIASIKEKYGFQRAETIEKFIMDYEILYHLFQELPCTLRGGMVVPFHQPDKKPRRLSEDVDVVTSLSIDEVRSAVLRTARNVEGLLRISEFNPKRKKPIPMIRYDAYYESRVTKTQSRVKIEIMYGFEIVSKILKKRLTGIQELFDFNVDYDLEIYERESLIADKLTALSIGTIGLQPNETAQITKHIYDIASLIGTREMGSIQNTLQMYPIFANYENSFRDGGLSFPYDLIIDETLNSLENTIDKRFYQLTEGQAGNHGNFVFQLLPTRNYRYSKSNHIFDIQLIRLFMTYIKQIATKKMMESAAAEYFLNDLNVLFGYSTMNGAERLAEGRQLIQDLPNSRRNYVKNQQLELIFFDKRLNDLNNVYK